MNRRDFLKIVSVLAGSAALPASVIASLPEEIPDKWFLSIHTADGLEYGRQEVTDTYSSYCLTQAVQFPMETCPVELTHAILCSPDNTECEFKLYPRVQLSRGIAPMFTAGALTLTEE